MIMKKTGLVIAAAAAAMILSGCATGARNIPDNSPICETPCCTPPCNMCKCVSSCKAVSKCAMVKKHKRKRHHRHHAENMQTQMNT